MINRFIVFIVLFVSQVALAQVAGDPISLVQIGAYSINEMKNVKLRLGIKTPTTSAVTAYKLSYYTTDVQGQLTIATAGVAVADDQPSADRPVISYQHGTSTKRKSAPSSGNFELLINMAHYASNGYVLVAADYLGMGDNMSLHPYLHAQTEASACADAILAIYKLNLSQSKQLFLSGYSQGGHATMALHRYWQQHYGATRPVTAAAPMAGPYDLSGSVVATANALSKISFGTVTYTGYLLLAMDSIYNLDMGLSSFVQAPYNAKLPVLFDGNHEFKDIAFQLPKTLPAFLTPDFISSIQNDPDNNPFVKVLKQNDVYDWKPAAPIQFCHGSADLDVPPFNTTKAMAHMASLGAVVSQADIPPGLNHGTAGGPCLSKTREFFETFRQ